MNEMSAPITASRAPDRLDGLPAPLAVPQVAFAEVPG
jgi:hypothetical protein